MGENIIHNDYAKPHRRVMSASSLSKDSVRNRKNEELGSIKDIMIDVPTGSIAYAVLSVGGFLGIGDRLFAIPWSALILDEDQQCFVIDIDKDRLENAPGFDKNNWPDMADPTWRQGVSTYWTDVSAPANTTAVREDYGVAASRPLDRATVAPARTTGVHSDDYGVAAGRQYDQETAATSEAEIERKAREAREAIDGPEGPQLRRAEELGKEPLKR